MSEQGKIELTWPEAAMLVGGGLAGAAMGVLAAIWVQGAVAAQSPVFWFASRAAAIVAYLLLWLSTAWGVTVSSKGLGGLVPGPLAYAMHNVLSWLALGFGMAHGVLLLGDQVVTFSLAAIAVPFASSYQPFLTGLGTLSLYLGMVVSAAFYLKKRLGYRAWRTIHGLSYAMFAAVTVHSILLGTHTATAPMRAIYLLAGASILYLTTFRILTAKGGKGPAAGVRRAGERPAA